MSQIGRIGGPVLSADLLRDGSDLAFETDLLYLSVADLSNPLKTVGLGVNNNSPSQKLQITGTSYFTKSDPLFPTDWIIDTQAEFADLVFLTYKIQNPTGNIVIRPNQSVDPKIVTNEIRTSKLKLVNSAISTLTSGDNIEITANGSGLVKFNTADVLLTGNLQVTGAVTWDGSTITIGSNDTDRVIFNADINSTILPDVNNLYTLGSTTKKWNTVYSKNIDALTLEANTLTINGIDMLLTQGNTIYVSVNGNDTNNGVHLHNTYRTVKHALSQAVAGDNIVIFPGTYIEDFPLTVPQGVSVTGAGIRAVTIYPSSGTTSNDAFLLNGETTVSHLSVGSFFYDSINDTGYGFRLAPNCLVTTRSPYVQNISILNKGSVTSLSDPNGFASGDAGRGALVDGSAVHPDSKEASILFHSVTFIVPNADGVTATNGARVEWLNSFTYFAYRGIYLTDGTVPSGSLIFSSSNYLSLSAPQTIGTQAYTFECFFYTSSNGLQTLLGAGSTGGMSIWLFGDGVNPVTTIQIDRSYVDAAQYTVSAITINTWHHIAVTRDSLNNASVFLDGVKATGSTTNTANYTGPSGLIGAVAGSAYFFTGYLTQIKLAVGSNYYDPTAASIAVPTALLTTSTNTKLLLTASTSSTYLTDTSGIQTVSNIGGVTYGTSTPFLVKSGAEFRSIGSANVYGTFGAVADGASTLGYLVGHNFAYIGTGADSQNDYDLVIQANEVVAINGGQLYYDSMDHKGDYRIGDIFYVNQQTGAITFNAQALDFSAGGSIVLEGASGRTEINAQLISTGNIVVHDNNVDSVLGPVNFSAQTGVTTLNTNVTVTGSLGVSGDVLVKGNVYLGNNPLDTVSVIPLLTQTIKPNVHDTFTLGTGGVTPKVWGNAYLTSVNIDNVTQLASNTIITLTTDTNLRLVAAGTGVISAPLKSVDITNNLQVIGTTTVNGTTSLKNVEIGTVLLPNTLTQTGNVNQTGDTGITGNIISVNNITGYDYLQSSRIQISGNYISAIDLDADINFTAGGSNGVILDSRLKITDNTISNVWSGATTNSEKSIYFTPNGTGNVVINSTKAIRLPTSNDSNRVLTALGEVRLNSTTLVFEGKISGGIIPLKGIYDSDRNTYITPELTVGANDNTLRFFNNGTLTTRINTTALLNNLIHIDNIRLSGNTVNNRITGDDLIFAPNTTGAINLNNLSFPENTIRNNTNGALTFNSTGVGYVKFSGTYGVVIPTGTGNPAYAPGTPQNQRPVTAEIGEVRHNTSLNYMEVYNGTIWIPAVGTLGAAPLGEVLDIMDFWSLILG